MKQLMWILLFVFLLSALPLHAQTPGQPGNVRLTKTVAWDMNAQCVAPIVCGYEVFLDGTLVVTTAQTTATFDAPTAPGLHIVTVLETRGDQKGAPSTIAFVETWMLEPEPEPEPQAPTMCTYIPPNSTVAQQRPRYTVDPVQGSLQGFNPIANQAARIAQLMTWGWRAIVNEFVDGSPRADKVDRIFLVMICDPPTP